MDPADPGRKIPIRLLIMDVLGIILAALGLAGLLTDVSGPLVFLADKNVAGIIAAVGFALVTFALGNIFRWLKRERARQQTQRQQGPGS
ncbi:MAG TPA: hypothetical protein VMH26_11350 [Burkholderiales bacterium]|nr:hypothetical protein [Burkholderiales bacterium]